MRKYKFSYLGYIATNWVLTVALLTMRGLGTEAVKVQEWLEGAIIFWGGSRVLFLWSKVFVADTDYKGVGTLDARITHSLTFALAIAEAATIILFHVRPRRVLSSGCGSDMHLDGNFHLCRRFRQEVHT